MRHWFFGISAVVFAVIAIAGWLWQPAWLALIVAVPVFLLGVRDSLQTRRAVLREGRRVSRARVFGGPGPEGECLQDVRW